MILGADGKKLSKRHGATSVEEYRDQGYLPDAFVNYLALLGWSLDGETTIVPRDVLASKFSLDHVSKNPATFDPKKLDWIQAEYIRTMTDKEFADKIMVPELHEAGLIEGNLEYDEAWIDALAAIAKPRTKFPADVVTVASPIFATAETLEYDEKSVAKGLAKEGMGAILDEAEAALADVEWTPAAIDAALEPLPEKLDLKKRIVFQAVRVAILRQPGEPAAFGHHGAHRPRRLHGPHRPRQDDGFVVPCSHTNTVFQKSSVHRRALFPSQTRAKRTLPFSPLSRRDANALS